MRDGQWIGIVFWVLVFLWVEWLDGSRMGLERALGWWP